MAISVWKSDGTETSSNLQKWQSAWSIFYWAWWIAFAPFVGLFLARVSRGRTIREYITTQSRELKRKRLLKNIYYLIISSSFVDDYDDAIRSIKMETDVSEVSLVEANALVEMVDAKLRAPLQITLGPDGLQRIFSVSGIVDAEMVKEQLI